MADQLRDLSAPPPCDSPDEDNARRPRPDQPALSRGGGGSRRTVTIPLTPAEQKRRPRRGVLQPPVPIDPSRPKTRADCAGGPRPCPWVSCAHHLYLDVDADTGTIKLNYPDLEPHELATSCALDVADAGAHSLDEVGQLLNVTRERIRQLEARALLDARRPASRRLR